MPSARRRWSGRSQGSRRKTSHRCRPYVAVAPRAPAEWRLCREPATLLPLVLLRSFRSFSSRIRWSCTRKSRREETALAASSVAECLDVAVDFANHNFRVTPSATILVDPLPLQGAVATAPPSRIRRLVRLGPTSGRQQRSALGATKQGGFPESSLEDKSPVFDCPQEVWYGGHSGRNLNRARL